MLQTLLFFGLRSSPHSWDIKTWMVLNECACRRKSPLTNHVDSVMRLLLETQPTPFASTSGDNPLRYLARPKSTWLPLGSILKKPWTKRDSHYRQVVQRLHNELQLHNNVNDVLSCNIVLNFLATPLLTSSPPTPEMGRILEDILRRGMLLGTAKLSLSPYSHYYRELERWSAVRTDRLIRNR